MPFRALPALQGAKHLGDPSACVGSACLGALGTWNTFELWGGTFKPNRMLCMAVAGVHGPGAACVGQGLLELRCPGVNPCPELLLAFRRAVCDLGSALAELQCVWGVGSRGQVRRGSAGTGEAKRRFVPSSFLRWNERGTQQRQRQAGNPPQPTWAHSPPPQGDPSWALADNTCMERRASSCTKVSALISWILLCWRPLEKQKLG